METTASKIDNVSFFDALHLFICKYERQITPSVLLSDIPMEEGKSIPDMMGISGKKFTAQLIAERFGLNSKFIRKNITDIHPDTAPFIFFMKDGTAAVADSFDKETGTVRVLTKDGSSERIPSELDCADAAFLIKRETVFNDSKATDKKNAWFFDAVRLSGGIYANVLLASLFINIFAVVTPLFTMNVYDRIVPNNAVESLWALSIGVVIVFVFDSVLKYLRHHFLEISAKKTEMMLSSRLFGKVMDYRLSDRPKIVGSFASNIKDFDMIRNFLSSSSLAVFVDFPFMIIFFAVIACIGGTLMFFIPLIICILILAYAFAIRKPLQTLIQDSYTVSARKNGLLIESLKCLETIKSFNFHKFRLWEWDSIVAKAANQSKAVKSYSYTMNTFFGAMVSFNTVCIIIAGTYLIGSNELTTGGLIATVMLSSRALSPVGQAISLITTYDQAKVAYKGINEIMQKNTESENRKDLVAPAEFKGEIEFRNVSFKYLEDGVSVLKNISFSIRQGEKVAILGKMGSGKTTIMKMLMGFYKPSDGEVTVDGISVSQINPASLRENIAYVSQKIEIFRGTLRQNITIRRTDADDDSVLRAIETASLQNMVNRHPKGLAGEIEEDGNNLSGGQKQAVGIARAFAAPFCMAFLDEPTDGIDHNAETRIIENLKNMLKDSTVVLITHKNNLLALVDRVIVLEDGQIIFDGPKEKMFKNNG
ncbi:MAG: type I secretion system permease/ATPase [Deferribacterales bacterium]